MGRGETEIARRGAARHPLGGPGARGLRYARSMEISDHRARAVFHRYNITRERDIREAMPKTQAPVKALRVGRTVLPFQRARGGGSR